MTHLRAKPDLSQVGVSHPASFAKRFIEMRTEQCSVAIRHPRLLASWGFHGFIMWETASDPWCYGAGLCTLKSSKIQKLSRILHHGAKTYMSLNDFVQGPGSNEENRFSARTADSPPGPSTWAIAMDDVSTDCGYWKIPPSQTWAFNRSCLGDSTPIVTTWGQPWKERTNFPRAQPKIFLWNPEIVFSFQLC